MTLWRLSALSFLVVLALACQDAKAQAPAKLVLNASVGAPYTRPDRSGFLDRLMAEIFERVGRRVQVVVHQGAARALLLANDGIEDGVAMRIAGLERNYPNLIRIPEMLIDNFFVAFAADLQFEIYQPEILASRQVAFISGWQILEKIVPPGADVTRVQDARQLFNLLRNGRTEIALYESWQGDFLLRELGIAARQLDPPVVRAEMFAYLHAKHADLIDGASRALAAMKQDGRWDRIFAETLGAR